jgi:hypothetical protein
MASLWRELSLCAHAQVPHIDAGSALVFCTIPVALSHKLNANGVKSKTR